MDLLEALHIPNEGKMVISVVGAGGKTSCMEKLKEQLVAKGKRVIITTTTQMYLPTRHVVLNEDMNAIKSTLNRDGFVIVGTKANEEKMKGVSQACFLQLLLISDVLLVEADGSRRLPIKFPATFEPVIREQTNRVIVVTGIDSVGKKISEVCHRFELAKQILKVEEDHLLDEKDVAVLIYKGYLENRNMNQAHTVFLNKVDTKRQDQMADTVLKYIEEMEHTQSILLKKGRLMQS
ncbi:MAG: selenium cofactor biosynthesis protein YqeC [Niameybacter sp.]|uniref:selenium cofactor biosynthesis protein YqeC n=1 Tax=Niameybacter sp. TaxID=2033640 RepID=UPI002FC6E5D8